MSKRCRPQGWHWVVGIAVLGIVLAASLGLLASAAELDKLDTSLKLVPDDAAFFSSALRCREQLDAIAKSQAWAKLKSMPIVQMGLALYAMQAASPDTVPGKIQASLSDPNVQQLLDLARDMTSQDMFVYGQASCTDLVELLQQVLGAMRYGPMMLQLSGKAQELGENRVQAMVLMTALTENLNLIKVPDEVFGFRLSNPAAANEQLNKLENLATAVLESNPQTKGRFRRSKVGQYEYLTLALDGQMIPWDELPLDTLRGLEAKPGDADKLIDRIKQLKMTIALGVRDNYLLLAIGSSTDCLARLGTGSRLIDRKEFQPLAEYVDKRLTGIAYLSQAMAARLNNGKKNIDDLVHAVNEMLPLASLPEEQEKKIRRDAAALADDLKRLIPEPGAIMTFSFLTDQGVEGYQYQWGDHSRLDSSRPLTLLEHVGGNPAVAIVGRGKVSVQDYDLLSKWLKTGYGYFEEFGLPQMSAGDREKLEKFMGRARPIFARLDKTNREMLLPALADGQTGFVLDTKLQSKQFLEALPATEQAMPMIEPALMLGVSDAALLRKACQEYFGAVNGLIDAARQADAEHVPPELKLPEPKVTTTSAGSTIYGYPLPKDWGVDKKIVPNLGISDTVAVFSITREHTERLLTATPLSADGLLAKADHEPLALAGCCNWAALVDAATPWINLGLDRMLKDQPGADAQAGGIRAQVHTVLDVLKVLRTLTSESYLKDGALVSHTLLEIRDVEK